MFGNELEPAAGDQRKNESPFFRKMRTLGVRVSHPYYGTDRGYKTWRES